MFAQLNSRAWRFNAKLNSCKKILLLNLLTYMHVFVYCVTIMAPFVSTEMSCVIRDYQVYKTVWTAVLGEELECRREVNNSVGRYAVGVYKLDRMLVGHLLRRLTTLVSLFLRLGGPAICRVTGSRQYSSDFPQGGLEIQCLLVFKGECGNVQTLKKPFNIL